MELKNRSFQYGKVALAVRTSQEHQLQFVLKVAIVCTDTRTYSRTRHYRTARSVMFWSKQRHYATLFQVVDVANPATVDALLEHAPHLIVHGI